MPEPKDQVWAKWKALISEQKSSGQTVAAFCRDRNIREWQYFAWKKRLGEAAAKQFVEVRLVDRKPSPATTGVAATAIEIRLERGHRLFVEPGFDANHLRAVVAALEARA